MGPADSDEIPGTRKIVQWLREAELPRPQVGQVHDGLVAGGPFAPEDVHDYRPSCRPPVPVLTVLDDGSSDRGEEVRLRQEVLTIGRAAGDVQVPNDPWISKQHAEIRRVPWRGGFQWQLHDCQSSNGTFVRCMRAVLHENDVVILGARRFRLRNPLRNLVRQSLDLPATEDTMDVNDWQVPQTVWPVLMEHPPVEDGLAFPLRGEESVIGRLGSRADIESGKAPAFRPVAHGVKHREQILSRRCQPMLVPRRVILIGTAFNHALFLQLAQPRADHLRGQAGVALKRVKAPHAEKQFTQEQQHRPVAEQSRGASNRTKAGRRRGSRHGGGPSGKRSCAMSL
jgi:hypothetical protein